MYRRIFILVEGADDERFFESIPRPILEEKYDSVQTWQYSGQPKKKTQSFLQSIHAMNADYFFLADVNTHPCVTARRQHLTELYDARLDDDRIIVVIREIESWYLAGLAENAARELGVEAFENTDDITKERFAAMVPRRFDLRIDFMQELLKAFSVEAARKKNMSFDYFLNRVS